MKAVVGLGNPEDKYRGTRHNIGFEVVRAVHKQASHGENFEKKTLTLEGAEQSALISESEKGILVMPQMYMNRSGGCVKALCQTYPVDLEDLLVVCDDVNLDCGQVRFRRSGSSGGQKGLQSIIEQLGSEDFSRLRVGIGQTENGHDTREYVLSLFPAHERVKMQETVKKCAEAVLFWMEKGIEAAMNQYNARS